MSGMVRTGRWARIAWGAVLLPLVAGLAFSFVWSIAIHPLAGLLILPISLYGAFLSIGIQAVVYTLLMEFAVWRAVGTNYVAIFVGALLGLVSGGFACIGPGDFIPNILVAGFVGGLVTALVLRLLRRRSEVADMSRSAPPAPGIAPANACSGACFFERSVSQ
jgi:hypothetical protein